MSESLAPARSAEIRSHSLAAGTTVLVETQEFFDSDNQNSSRFLLCKVLDDLHGPDGSLAVPSGSNALVVIRSIAKQGLNSVAVFGLNRIEAGGTAFQLSDGAKDMAVTRLEEDSSRGAGHRDVHLAQQSRLEFKLDTAVQSK